jgi:tetratricopeptide (TPR) repeat protein
VKTIQNFAVNVSLTLAAVLLFGCPPASTGPAKSIATATGPAEVAAPPLDAKALVSLADLQPPLAKPVNPSASTTAAAAEDVSKFLAEAEKDIAKKDFFSAKQALDRAIGFDPNNPRVLRDMGMTYVGLDNAGLAVKFLQKSAAATPDDLEVQVLRGKLLQDLPDQAILAYRTALLTTQAKPENPLAAEALLHLATLLSRAGYFTASLDAYNQLDSWLQAHGDNYTANAALQPYLLRPEELLTRRGWLMLRLHKPAQAAQVLAKAYNGDRGNPDISRLLTESLIEDKQYDRAGTLILEMASQPGQQAQLVLLAQSLTLGSGNKELPLKIWQAYLQSGKKDTSLALAMAEVSRKVGAPDQAQKILASAMEKQPGSIPVSKALVELLVSSGQYDSAVVQLADVVSRDPNQVLDAQRTIQRISAYAPPDYHRLLAGKFIADASSTAAQCYLSGQLARARGDQSLAAKLFELAVTRSGNFLPAYEALVDLGLDQAQPADVKKTLDRVAKLDDAQFGYFKAYLRGKVALSARNVEGAIKELSAAREAKNDYVPALRLLARAYLAASSPTSDRSDEATRVLMEAIRVDSDNEELYGMLMGLLMQKGQVGDVQQLLNQLFERHPDSIVGKIVQVEMLLKAGQKAEALKMLEQVKKAAPNNPDVQLLDFQLTYSGKQIAQFTDKEWQEAVDRLRGILKADPSQAQALRFLIALLNAPGHKAQAAEIWGKVYDETHRTLLISKVYAQVLFEASKYAKCLEVAQALYETNPRDNEVRKLLLATLEKLKKDDQAAQLAEGWLKDAQDERERLAYRQVLVKFYENSKQFDKAQKLLDDWILLEADSRMIETLRDLKLTLYSKATQYDKMIQYGKAWIDEARADQQAARQPRALLLSLLDEAKQYDKALELVDDFIKKDTDFQAQWQTEQILLLGEAGQLDKGRQVATDVIAKNAGDSPAGMGAREAVVMMYRRAGKYDQALAMIDSWMTPGKVPATGPAAPPATLLDWCRVNAVQLLIAQEKYADAIQRVDSYLPAYKDWKPAPPPPAPFPGAPQEKAKPNPAVELQIYKGNCLGELGHKDQQMILLEKLIAQYPDNSLLDNDLGYLYSEQGINLDKAERMIRKAVDAEPNSPSVADSLGWVFYKQGKFDAAGVTFDHILAIDSVKTSTDSGVIFDHAGDVAFRQGNSSKALELWTTALEKGRKEKTLDSDTRKMIVSAAAKIEAVKKGRPPVVAPLGKDVKVPASK